VKTTRKLLIGAAAAVVLVGGCSAASHVGALQPPKLPHPKSAPPAATLDSAISISKPKFQLGAGIDLYGYHNEDYVTAGVTEVKYLEKLHANSVEISFPLFMNGADARGVYAKYPVTPTPAELGSLIILAENGKGGGKDGLYVSLRPLLSNASIDAPRNTWKPADMKAWFASYQRFLIPYAKMAQKDKVHKLYVGAEFQDFATSPLWNRLDRALHRVYKGTLAYANNGREFYRNMGGRRAQISADSYPDMTGTSAQASVGQLTGLWRRWIRGSTAYPFDSPFPAGSHDMPRGTVLSEVGIAGAVSDGVASYAKPYMIAWPDATLDPALQARWFTAACHAAKQTRMAGIYFWAIGFGKEQLAQGLDPKHQSAWEAGAGAHAATACFERYANG
jgi:hypothetical protein